MNSTPPSPHSGKTGAVRPSAPVPLLLAHPLGQSGRQEQALAATEEAKRLPDNFEQARQFTRALPAPKPNLRTTGGFYFSSIITHALVFSQLMVSVQPLPFDSSPMVKFSTGEEVFPTFISVRTNSSASYL